MTALVQDAFADLNGLPFHYRDWGGTGRPMILLHGLASNARFWDLAAPHLTPHHRVIALDQRGHGASAKTEDGYDFPTVAGDVASFIRAVDMERPILVGHSWGGNVGVQVAADNPDLLAGLVCIDGGIIEPSAAPGATWEETEKALAPPDFAAMRLSWDTFLERVRGMEMGTLWGNHLETFLRANFEIQPDGTVLPHLRRERHMLIVRALWEQRVSGLFPRIACPVLFMPTRRHGEAGSSAGPQDRKEAQVAHALEAVPRARVVWMEDSVHDVPVQRPQQVARAVLDTISDGFFDV
ncbi:MAG: alpha/beta hydrolase [Chloroflexi bacterium]|nr:alpha/beta hydrolase [Chloroflexota bacterium]